MGIDAWLQKLSHAQSYLGCMTCEPGVRSQDLPRFSGPPVLGESRSPFIDDISFIHISANTMNLMKMFASFVCPDNW